MTEEAKSLGSRDSRVSPAPQQEAPNAVVSDEPKTSTDRGTILTALSKHFIFTSLKDENSLTLIDSMKPFRLTTNEIVFEQTTLLYSDLEPGTKYYQA